MIEVVSLCPFDVATLLWEARRGEWTLTVAIKATFVLQPDAEATLAEAQDRLGDDRHWDDGASLHTANDRAPFKPRADIVLVGRAHAPGGVATTALDARLVVGDFEKTVRVTGDRGWRRVDTGLVSGPPAPFVSMPLRYERAARGTENPVGIDPRALASTGAPALPNLAAVEVAGRPPRTPGFGPVSPIWPARRSLLGDEAFSWAVALGRGDAARAGAGPAPAGVDFGFFNAAPRDQQVDLLRAGTSILLENLHPDHPRLETRLPGLRPRVYLRDPATGRPREIALRCDTLAIDGDRGIATLVWRGLTDVASSDEARVGRVVVVLETKGTPTRIAHVDKLLRDGNARAEGTEPAALGENRLNLRHDAVKSHAAGGPVSSLADPRTDAEDDVVPRFDDEPSAGTWEPARVERFEPTRELLAPAFARESMPFRSGSPASEAGASPPEAVATVDADHTREIRAPAWRPATPFAPPPAPPAELEPADVGEGSLTPEWNDDDDDDTPLEASESTPVRPSAPSTPDPERPARVVVVAPDASPSRSAADVGIAEYAAVTAELAERRPSTKADVLREHGFTDALWAEVDRHWRAAINVEVDRGKSDLLTAYDTAYVSSQQRFRDPIGLAEYARIVVGVERGEIARVLAQLKLQLSDLMRLQRVWTRKVADDPALAAELGAAVEAARSLTG